MTMKTLRVLTSCLLLITSLAQADIYVVTHRDNPIVEMDEQQIKDLYLGRTKAFSNGAFAHVYERDDALRERFVQSLLNMRVRQFDAYWARLIFAGRVLPLNRVENDSELLERIKKDVHAIGYINHLPASDELKTVLRIRD